MKRKNKSDYTNCEQTTRMKLLNQKDLIEEALVGFLNAYEELSQREDTMIMFLDKLCSYSYTTKTWFILWQGGRAYRYSELLPYVGCSPSTLGRSLMQLMRDGLIMKRGAKYQAISPAWLTPMRKLE